MRQDASVFLFPSVHDDAPWVVAEAAAQGLPVVCIQRGGPPLLQGSASPPQLRDMEPTTSALARAIERMRGETGSSSWDIDSRQGNCRASSSATDLSRYSISKDETCLRAAHARIGLKDR